ncbi:acyltransferase family protein [Phenylobacterium aquaticum]|uniref:acyltransferase family protein n=1 Tax=Phenylobacterium aquaticum TaxID=1763816 RepID=UPI001F5C70A6|nr:acyltransferase [Phenylobacterium aquaticum]MCI3133241.1 acyltransferase [Phenylobacterium aquaticum]
MPQRKFQTLDGLRGLAAAAVVMFHLHHFFPGIWRPVSAYLAVDLFFALSGFVLAEAYSRKLDEGLSFRAFMTKRLARLWPLYALGLAIAALPLGIRVALGQAPAGDLTPILPAALMLPWPSRDGLLYPLNIAAWSLFFELIANALMVLVWRWLSREVLTAIVVLSAIGLAASALTYGSLDFGFTLDGAPTAPARVMFSFFLGLLIWRAAPAAPRISPWFPVLGLALILVCAPGPALRPAFDMLAVTMMLPALLWLGAAAEPGPRSLPLFEAAGAASYAVYVTHVPIMNGVSRTLDARTHLDRGAVGTGAALAVLAALLVLAWGLNAGDVGLRRRLARPA